MRDNLTEDLLQHVNEKVAFHIQSALDALDTQEQTQAFLLGFAVSVIGNSLAVFTNDTSPFPLLRKLSYVQQVQVMVSTVAMLLTPDTPKLDLSDTQTLSDMLAASHELSSGIEIQVKRGLRHGAN